MRLFRYIHEWIMSLRSSAELAEKIQGEETPIISSPLPKRQSTFDPNSERAKQGLAFQSLVFEQLKEVFPEVDSFEETWDYFKERDPTLEIYDLACLEKEYGDITFLYEGQRFWVECCYAMGKKSSWFCEMKRLKFKGINKWYCWGKSNEPGRTWFIQSASWNKYVSKCDKVRQGKKSFRVVPKNLIGDNLFKAKRGPSEFKKAII